MTIIVGYFFLLFYQRIALSALKLKGNLLFLSLLGRYFLHVLRSAILYFYSSLGLLPFLL